MSENTMKANALLAELNEAIKTKNVEEINRIKPLLEEVIEEMNADLKAKEFGVIINAENPALEAIKKGFLVLTKLSTDSETGGFKLGDRMEIIDFQEISEISVKSQKSFFANTQALFFIEALNHAVCDYMIARMGIKEKSKKLQGFKLSATASVLGISVESMKTIKGLTPALQKVTDSIIEGQKITSDEAETLLFNYSKWSGKAINGVSMAIESNFRRMIMRVLYKLVNDVEFIAE